MDNRGIAKKELSLILSKAAKMPVIKINTWMVVY